MRTAILVIMAVALIGADSPGAAPRTPEAQAKLDKILGGRVAGEPVACLKSDRTYSPVGIDDRTILFKDGPRIWRNDLEASFRCGDLGAHKSLVTTDKNIMVCRGDKMHIVDLQEGDAVGACVLGRFVPYTKP